MIACQNCGTTNDDNAKYCHSCGTEIDHQQNFGNQQSFDSQQSVGFGMRQTGENLVLHCTLCGNEGSQNFSKDTGRLDSKWGFTSFKMVLMTCNRCGHVEMFNQGRSIFTFD